MIDTTKKRKVSKKTKKSWRKNVDIKDVDKFLENKRLVERLGGAFSKRPDSQLFIIDKNQDKSLLLSKAERRARLKLKEPKCFAILKPHTSVPDPITKRNRVKTAEERKNPITRRIEAERRKKGILKLREKISLKDKAIAEKNRGKRYKRGEFKEDIWQKEIIVPEVVNNEWFTSDTIRHTLANTGKKRKQVPISLAKKPSILPAVEIPHPGTSYNPSLNDHQDLLRQVAEKQLKFEKEEAHLNRVTTKMFQKVSAEEKDRNSMKEMSEGLQLNPQVETENINDDEDDDPVVKSVNPPAKNVKKTLQTRRKQKEQRKMKLEHKYLKVEKKKVADIYKLKRIHKVMEKKEKKEQVLRELRDKKEKRKELEPKVLSKVKFEAQEPDFKLGGELTGNLRNTDPVGNLLKDRYKSLQQRNIVAPGTLVLKRSKANVKKYIKADHKIKVDSK